MERGVCHEDRAAERGAGTKHLPQPDGAGFPGIGAETLCFGAGHDDARPV